MIAVIFEVEPHPDHRAHYLEIAAVLRPELENIEGFISVERFRSLTDDRKILSLSFFEDEAAVTRWRYLCLHHEAQEKGRSGVFTAYRLRVAGVIRDYGLAKRAEAPDDSRDLHGG